MLISFIKLMSFKVHKKTTELNSGHHHRVMELRAYLTEPS